MKNFQEYSIYTERKMTMQNRQYFGSDYRSFSSKRKFSTYKHSALNRKHTCSKQTIKDEEKLLLRNKNINTKCKHCLVREMSYYIIRWHTQEQALVDQENDLLRCF